MENKLIMFNDSHDYDLTIDKTNNEFRLTYAGDTWSEKLQNQLAASLKDTGNDFVIRIKDIELTLDYNEAVQILILLLFEKDFTISSFIKEKEF
jgi:hypothetical protein